MHTILYGVASQTLRHVPPERVTSATYVVQDLLYDTDDAAGLIASGSATVDDLSLTVDAISGAGQADPRSVYVSSTTGASVGDTIVVRSVDGGWEHARISGVVSGDYLRLEQPLLGTYTSGDSVLGTLVSAPFPDATAADEDYVIQDRPLRVVWTYTIGGATRRTQEPVRIARQRDGSAYEAIALERMRSAYPDLAHKVGDPGDLYRWIAFCADDLRSKMLARDIDPGTMLTGEQGIQALTYRLVLHVAEQGISPSMLDPMAFLDIARAHFDQSFGSLVTGETGRGVIEVTSQDEQAIAQRTYRSPWGRE